MKRRVDFFVPGFSKCGTTSLFEILDAHPSVFIPEVKEPNFFGLSDEVKDFKWYESFYTASSEEQVLGDCSTFYSSIVCDKKSCEEIYQHNPDAKFIFIVRDPVGRIESSFREMHNSSAMYGFCTPFKLSDALMEIPQIIDDTAYYSRLMTYVSVFGKDKVLVIGMEELKSRPDIIADKCYSFLGLEGYSFSVSDTPYRNRGEEKLYDSALFRWARSARLIGPWLSKINIHTQDYYATKLGLRKRFVRSVEWDDYAVKIFMSRLHDEVELFCDVSDISSESWLKYKKIIKE